MASKKEQFLVFLKPDAYLRKYIGAKILDEIHKNKDYEILAFKEVTMSDKHARRHYQEHKGKDFFPWLLKFIKIGPVLAMIVKGDIQKFREMIGSTRCQEADSHSIRGNLGVWGGVNLIHASDSSETAKKELKVWNEEISLAIDKKVEEKIKDYISTWSLKDKNYSKQLKEHCSELVNSKNPENEIRKKLIELLKEECYTSDEGIVKLFTDVIIEACKL
ncbi:MAG: nucleoside-diphosphate kinase [Candidatus Hodarchaeota archaeon]